MAEPTLAALLELVNGRRGYFRLESGHHGGLWLDLDALFAHPRAIEPCLELRASGALPVEAVVHDGYQLREPADCPLCAEGQPLEDVAPGGTHDEAAIGTGR